MTVDVYWINENKAMMLKSEKFVAKPDLHSLINSTTAEMLITFEVNGAEIEAYAWDKESPTSACFRAPQSLAPSPHITTTLPRFWYIITILALSLGLVRAYTVALVMNLLRKLSILSMWVPIS
jgi:hypothetical protein